MGEEVSLKTGDVAGAPPELEEAVNETSAAPPAADGNGTEAAATVDVGKPPVPPNGHVVALVGQLWALKNAMDARPTSAEVQDLRSTLEEVQRSIAPEPAMELEPEVEAQPDDTDERVAVLGTQVEELKRIIRPTAASGRVDPAAIPPPVLQEVYEKTLTGIYQEMVRQFGPGAPRITGRIMEEVRRASSGMEFFRLVDDRRIEATGLSAALQRKLFSPHQVHVTYNEFFRRLVAEVPQHRAQSLVELVSTSTSAYTVATVANLVEEFEGVERAQEDIAGRLERLEAQIRGGAETRDQQGAGKGSAHSAAVEVKVEPPESVGGDQAKISTRLEWLEDQVQQVIATVDERLEQIAAEQKSGAAELEERHFDHLESIETTLSSHDASWKRIEERLARIEAKGGDAKKKRAGVSRKKTDLRRKS